MRNRKKHTLWLRDGDWDYLESVFAPNGTSTSEAIRTLVSSYVDKLRERERAVSGDQEPVKVRIDL